MSGDVMWYRLPGFGLIELTGPDSRDYLNRMTTNSVAPMAPGDVKRNLMLRGDGRLVGDFYIICQSPDRFLLLVPYAAREGLVAQLDMFLIMEKVEIRDLSDDHAAVCIKGNGSMAALERLCPNKLPGNAVYTSDIAAGMLCPDAPLSRPKVLLWGPPEGLALITTELERDFGPEQDSEAIDRLRIEDGEPLFGVDVDSSTIPLEASLRDAIDFNKGCFPGQEIVARIDNLGHPANMLVGLRAEENVLAPGALVFAGEKPIGRVTTAARAGEAEDSSIALGYVKWDQRLAGTLVQVQTGGEQRADAAVVELPMTPTEPAE